MEILTYIILALVLIVIIWAIAIYNRLIKLVVRSKEAWSDIDVQLKRRYDLIPNLINTVKGYASHESDTFQKVTDARSNALSAEQSGNPAKTAEAENILSGALKSLFAVAENYPDLKANENFLELQKELSDTENKIQASRRFYNGNVRDLNTAVQTFPQNIISKMFNFTRMDFFEVDDDSFKEPVKVNF